MKKLLVLSLFLSICTFAFAHTINWRVGNNILSTTTCDSGDSITPPTAPEKYGYHFVKWNAYAQLEYIESTGTQYIDTGVVGNLNTEYEITVKSNVTPSAGGVSAYAIFGSRTSATANSIMSIYSSEGVTNDFGNYTVTRQVVDIPNMTAHRCKITNSKSKRTTTDLDTGWTDTVTTEYSGSLATPTNLYIGYAGSLGGLLNVANLQGRIYSCKIWDNGRPVRDFIPVLDADGTPCLLDKVENKFYYNQGTGDFIAGPVL